MCRLFGFRSVIQSQVHRSLVSAENALMRQSEKHPDGWGVAYYVANSPHLIRSVQTAIEDSLFRHVSGIVSSETVLAHLRRATQGELSIINCHPFQYGNWVFAHNGNVGHFAERREELVARVTPVLRRFILGKTDSELLFYLILGHMQQRYELHRRGYPVSAVAESIEAALEEVIEVTGGVDPPEASGEHVTHLTFIITNGHLMLAHHGGRDIFYSTYKRMCPERDSCPSFSHECENPTESGFVNHMVFSSEPLHGDNVWVPMRPGQMVAVDWRMQLADFQHDLVPPGNASYDEAIEAAVEAR